jgi:Tfp pilus assembly protein PilX
MLAITKNKSKQSTASVKFTSKPKKTKTIPRQVYIPVVQQQTQQTQQTPQILPGVQNQLTETTFRQYLGGFVGILPNDLPRTTGKRLRYAIDTVDANGRILSTQYRLGGIVKSVSPDLSSVVMFNPYAKKSWTLRIPQPANKRLRLYFAEQGAGGNSTLIRSLINKLQTGQLHISRR